MIRWLLAGVAVAVALGWAAAQCHRLGFAPVGLISLLVGVALGLCLGLLAAALRVAGGRALVLGAVILGLATVLAEHAWLYRDFRRQWGEAREAQPQIALFRPEEPWSPREYLAREATPGRVLYWCFDAALISAAAALTVAVFPRIRTSSPDATTP